MYSCEDFQENRNFPVIGAMYFAVFIKETPMKLAPVKPPNTFVGLATKIANIQNRSECWVCMEPPTGSLIDLHLTVLPLTFFEHLSNPVGGLTAIADGNHTRWVFAPKDSGANTNQILSPLWVEKHHRISMFYGKGG